MAEDLPTFRELEAFCAAAREGSFATAAQAMDTSTARVRGNVANLERKLRLSANSLLIASRGGVTPSPQGAVLLQSVQQVIRAVDRLKGHAGLVRRGEAEEFRMGCYPAHLQFVAPAIAEFQDQRPWSRVEVVDASDDVRESGGWTLITRLIEGRIDFAVAPDRYELPAHLTADALYSWQLLVAHRDQASDQVSILDLRDKKLLASPSGHTSHEMARAACLAAGFSPEFSVESTSTEGLTSLARAGLGWAILPSDAIYLHRDLKWRPLIDKNGSPIMGTYALYRTRDLADGGSLLRNLLRQHARHIGANLAPDVRNHSPISN